MSMLTGRGEDNRGQGDGSSGPLLRRQGTVPCLHFCAIRLESGRRARTSGHLTANVHRAAVPRDVRIRPAVCGLGPPGGRLPLCEFPVIPSALLRSPVRGMHPGRLRILLMPEFASERELAHSAGMTGNSQSSACLREAPARRPPALSRTGGKRRRAVFGTAPVSFMVSGSDAWAFAGKKLQRIADYVYITAEGLWLYVKNDRSNHGFRIRNDEITYKWQRMLKPYT